MMRAPRLGVVVMLTVGLVVSTGITGGAETAQKAPRGFHIVKVKKAGFSIAVPDGWSVVDPTRKDADQILDSLREAFFLTGDIPNAATLTAQKVVLFAADSQPPTEALDASCPECSLVTLTVGFDAGTTQAPTVAEVASLVAQLPAPGAWAVENFQLVFFQEPVDAHVSETKIAGADAVKAEFDYLKYVSYSLEETDRHMIQYTLAGKRGGYIFRFEALAGVSVARSRCPCAPTTGDLDALDDFDTMADSIRLLKGHR